MSGSHMPGVDAVFSFTIHAKGTNPVCRASAVIITVHQPVLVKGYKPALSESGGEFTSESLPTALTVP